MAEFKTRMAGRTFTLVADTGSGLALRDAGAPAIDRFSGKHRWLSNFWPVEVVYEREAYRSVEHAYQAAKTTDRHQRQLIQAAESAGHAKRLAKTLTVREDWSERKLSVMEALLRQKFAQAPLRAKLLASRNWFGLAMIGKGAQR